MLPDFCNNSNNNNDNNYIVVKEKEDLLHHLIHDHAIIVGLYGCPYCEYKSDDRSLVRDHIWNTHIIKIKSIVEHDECPYCDYLSNYLR